MTADGIVSGLDCVMSYLSPYIKSYHAQENLDDKALLVPDNTSGHPVNIDDNIHVMFLPRNKTSLLHPMDQGVIATFKPCYFHHTMRDLLQVAEGEDRPETQELWKAF